MIVLGLGTHSFFFLCLTTWALSNSKYIYCILSWRVKLWRIPCRRSGVELMIHASIRYQITIVFCKFFLSDDEKSEWMQFIIGSLSWKPL